MGEKKLAIVDEEGVIRPQLEVVEESSSILDNSTSRKLEDVLTLVERKYKYFVNLIKCWVARPAKENKLALCAVAQLFPDEIIKKVSQDLTKEEKEIWKNLYKEELSQKEINEGTDIIQRELIKELILPSFDSDTELLELTNSLTLDDLVYFNSIKPDILRNLVCYLDLATVNEFLNLVTPEQFQEILVRIFEKVLTSFHLCKSLIPL